MRKQIISVIVPVVHEPAYLFRKVVDSVLEQTWEEMQLLIVDDGVKEQKLFDIMEIASKDPRTKVLKRGERTTDFRTCSEAYDLGLDNVDGDWMFLNAADDHFELDWAERMLKFAEGREEELLGVCTNWYKHNFDGSTEVVDMKKNWDWSKSSLENHLNRESMGSWVFRWDKIKDLRHDARFPRSQTREYLARVLKRGNVEHLPKFLWHFNEWREDQWTKYGSIRWRILCDLKNGFEDVNNLGWSLGLSQRHDKHLYYAVYSAVKEFTTNEKWKKDYEASEFKKEFERVEGKCFEEAKAK